jgi:hypothetical protein
LWVGKKGLRCENLMAPYRLRFRTINVARHPFPTLSLSVHQTGWSTMPVLFAIQNFIGLQHLTGGFGSI